MGLPESGKDSLDFSWSVFALSDFAIMFWGYRLFPLIKINNTALRIKTLTTTELVLVLFLFKLFQ